MKRDARLARDAYYFGLVIKRSVLERRGLSLSEKLVLAYVTTYRKGCFEPNTQISRKLGIGKRTVERAVKTLAAKKEISIIHKKGSVRVIKILSREEELTKIKQKILQEKAL